MPSPHHRPVLISTVRATRANARDSRPLEDLRAAGSRRAGETQRRSIRIHARLTVRHQTETARRHLPRQRRAFERGDLESRSRRAAYSF